MKVELNKEERDALWRLANHIVDNGSLKLQETVSALKALDSKDNGNRVNEWLEETRKEHDFWQTIKAKLTQEDENKKSDEVEEKQRNNIISLQKRSLPDSIKYLLQQYHNAQIDEKQLLRHIDFLKDMEENRL